MFRVSVLAAALLAAVAASPGGRGPVTDHFDGKRFHNLEPLTIGPADWIRYSLTKRRGPWRDFTDTPPGPPPPRRIGQGGLRVTLVNHSTVLIQMDGLNILTDPTWSPRSAPLGPHRRRPPGVCFEDLPPIDAVLVSHNHHDHMDLPTLRRLSAMGASAVCAGLGNSAFLAEQGVPGVVDLDWWQPVALAPGITVTAVPARHMSGRGLFDHDRTLWCGFVVEGLSGSVYFAGDTGWGSHFAAIGKRFPGLSLALLPIGGFKPTWYMREQHLGPEDALQAQRDLGAWTMVPMHFGTFPNGEDAETEAVDLLRTLLAAAPDLARRVAILDNGQSLDVPFASQD